MTIQFNTDRNISGSEELTKPLKAMIEGELELFRSKITRLEIHISDENADKNGDNDKRCIVEARLESLQPIAVTHHANTPEEAVIGAISKLKTSISSTLGRLSSE